MVRHLTTIIVTILVSFGTALACEEGWREFLCQVNGYDVDLTHTSPTGIRYDPSGQWIDVEALDRQTDEVEQCLTEQFGAGLNLPVEVRRACDCGYGDPVGLPIDRSRIKVKLVDDWVLSWDGEQQLLKDKAPAAACAGKPRPDGEDIPCRWRVAIQDDEVIVITPSQYLYKDGLIKMLTGCWVPWSHPDMAKCARPTVPMMPTGPNGE